MKQSKDQRTVYRCVAWRCLVTLIVFITSVRARGADEQEAIEFARDVQPILAQHCVTCHGAERQESNYRLDTSEGALGVADSGKHPIVPGKPEESRLLHVVRGDDADQLEMPPRDDDSKQSQVARLSAEQIAVLESWIAQGAPWPADVGLTSVATRSDHWSLQPRHSIVVPDKVSHWGHNSIDRFIEARLRTEQLSPSPPAERHRLIRRVYLDFLGLPPTPQEVDAFVNDRSPQAYERLVDRVLANPHHGERWARHWLDVIRFGESDGFETNPERPRAWLFRDYVIQSLNEDKPYDEFVREQLAGDAYDADVATGYLVAGPYDRVKSPDVSLTLMQRQDELADIISTTGSTFLGLTVGCARCHNHKFDPITQQDYYGLQAVFTGVQHGERAIASRDAQRVKASLERLRTELAQAQAEVDTLRESTQARSIAANGLQRDAVNPRLNVESFAPVEAIAVRFTIVATAGGGEPCVDEFEVFSAENRSSSGSGESVNVALASRGATVKVSGTLPGYAIHQPQHLHDGEVGNAHSWISDRANQGWIEIHLAQPTTIERIVWGRDRLEQFRDRVPVDYRVEVSGDLATWQTVASSADRRPYAGEVQPFAFLALLDGDERDLGEKLRARVETLQHQLASQESQLPMAYVGTFAAPGPTHRLYRGDPMSPREVVPVSAIRALGEMAVRDEANEQSRRVALAEWITRDDNPLTARVIVNRVWQHHFGTGIVATPSDFGANGATPSHPELLDWLANELVRHDWSLHWLHRTILLSATYQQSSAPNAEGLKRDAASRLLWRFPPRRLEAETIRDEMLFVAGTLQPTLGGPGYLVFDVQRETVHHYFPKARMGPAEWRRAIYMTKIRMEQDGVFGVFDCPDGGQVMPARSRSTTPLQALNLFNSPWVLDQSEHLAKRLADNAPSDVAAQVRHAFRLLFAREPSDDEIKWSIEFIDHEGLPAFARSLLNTNEFLFLF